MRHIIPITLFTSFTLLTLTVPAQTYETLRDSGFRAYDKLLFEDAVVQFEAAEKFCQSSTCSRSNSV